MKKKLVSMFLVATMALSLVACGSSSTDTATNETEATQTEQTEQPTQSAAADIPTVSAGKLTVATSPDFAPYEFYAVDESGTPQLAGFDIALAQYIAWLLKAVRSLKKGIMHSI